MTSIIPNKEIEAMYRADELTGDIFIAISSWAKETNNLQPYQRSICYSVGRTKLHGKQISVKLALHAMKAYDEAISLGFEE